MFSTIQVTDNLPAEVIARVEHNSGALQVNSARWKKLTKLDREFVILHELAHLQDAELDERKTNLTALSLFFHRGKIKGDLDKRVRWLATYQNAHTQKTYSNVTNIADAVKGVADFLNTGLNKLFEDKGAAEQRELIESEGDKNRALTEFLARMKQDGYIYIAGIVLLIFIGLITLKAIR